MITDPKLTTEPAPIKRTGASLNKGHSRQDYATPLDFIQAVEERFGELSFDLAASESNKKAPFYFDAHNDALSRAWDCWIGNAWLNPPFKDVAPWMERCAHYATARNRIIALTRASVSTEWFAKYVEPHAFVLAIRPRLTFIGEPDPYPADLMLSCFGFGVTGFKTWKWS